MSSFGKLAIAAVKDFFFVALTLMLFLLKKSNWFLLFGALCYM